MGMFVFALWALAVPGVCAPAVLAVQAGSYVVKIDQLVDTTYVINLAEVEVFFGNTKLTTSAQFSRTRTRPLLLQVVLMVICPSFVRAITMPAPDSD